MQPPPPVAAVNAQPILQPVVMQQPNRNAKVTIHAKPTKVLSIIQITIGILMLGFGLALILVPGEYIFKSYGGSGICAMISSVWIVITGMMGIFSYKLPTSHLRNGTHMGFCIVSTHVAFINIIIYSIGVVIFSHSDCKMRYNYHARQWYHDCSRNTEKAETAISGVLIFLSVAEFIASLTASIYTCVFCCCGNGGCCQEQQGGAVLYQPQQQYIITTTTQPTQYITSSQGPPAATYPASGPTTTYPAAPQYVSSGAPYYPQASVSTQGMEGQTNVTYSMDGPPPAYHEKEVVGVR